MLKTPSRKQSKYRTDKTNNHTGANKQGNGSCKREESRHRKPQKTNIESNKRTQIAQTSPRSRWPRKPNRLEKTRCENNRLDNRPGKKKHVHNLPARKATYRPKKNLPARKNILPALKATSLSWLRLTKKKLSPKKNSPFWFSSRTTSVNDLSARLLKWHTSSVAKQ